MNMVTTLKVFDIQDYSVHDGPGIRLSVFLQGCPLRCKWCHSPESQTTETKILWLGAKCIGCQKCVAACPTGARTALFLDGPDEKPTIWCDWDKCTNCGACESVCIPKALYYCGTERDIDGILHRLEREKPYFIKSGGGLTVSGGECLLQYEGVAELLKGTQELGLNTAVDTCGLVPWKNIEAVLPYTDLFLYDIKHMDSDKHAEGTGVHNELILENARKIAAAGGKMQIRIPLIPGFNDGANIEATRDFLLELGDAVVEVQVLPYHNYGNAKYARLSREVPDYGFEVPSDELVQGAVDVFLEAGIPAVIH